MPINRRLAALSCLTFTLLACAGAVKQSSVCKGDNCTEDATEDKPLKGLVSNVDGTVFRVWDGDTVLIKRLKGTKSFVCELYGTDAPELPRSSRPGQPFGRESKVKLGSLIYGQVVTARLTGRRIGKREICIIDYNGHDVNFRMIQTGHSWAFKPELGKPYAPLYMNAENDARKRRLGLWKDPNPEPPWLFRIRHKKTAN